MFLVRIGFCVWLLLVGYASVWAQAEAVLQLREHDERSVQYKHLFILPANRTKAIDAPALQQDTLAAFQLDSVAPKGEAFWVKVLVDNWSGQREWVVRSSFVYNTQVWVRYPDGTWFSGHFGRSLPAAPRLTLLPSSFGQIVLPQGVSTVYLKVELPIYVRRYMNLQLVRRDVEEGARLLAIIIQVGVLSSLLLMFFYNGFIYLYVQDRSYLYYTLSIGFVALYLLFSTNEFGFTAFYGNQNLFLDTTLTAISNTGVILSQIFLHLFSRRFTNTRQRYPWWHKFIGSYVLSLVFVNLSFIAVHSYFALQGMPERGLIFISLGNLNLLLSFAVTISFGLMLIYRRDRLGRILAVGYIVMLLFAILYMLGAQRHGFFAVLTPNWLITNSLKIGLVLQMLLFSFALAERIKILREENEKTEAEKRKLEFRSLQEIKHITEQKNQELEQKVTKRTTELRAQKEELSKALALLSSQSSEISRANYSLRASVQYAQRIQAAVLPPATRFDDVFGNGRYFVLFRPRDIVSGDFYFLETIGNTTVLAVADCTGHGVPGAFMSLIGMQILNNIILKNNIVQPDTILDMLQWELRQVLQQSNKVDDGMDVAVLTITRHAERMHLQFAGAGSDMYYLHQGQLQRVRGNSRGIGGRTLRDERPFAGQTIELQGSVQLYLYSDGYPDQLGGANVHRLMKGPFRELLQQAANVPMPEQQLFLTEYLEQWMQSGSCRQTDDITLVGLHLDV